MIDYDKRLYVYWNIQKKTWSVRQSGKVVAHTDTIYMKDCRFLVGKAGQARVRREGKKNVHAGVSGYLAMYAEFHKAAKPVATGKCWVTYNPYKHDTFVQRTGVCDDKYPIPVTESGWAKLYILEGKPTVYAVNHKVNARYSTGLARKCKYMRKLL